MKNSVLLGRSDGSDDDTPHKLLSQLTLEDQETRKLIICDAGYGFPVEARPRREKLFAVSKQLFNFLKWQTSQTEKELAEVKVCVSCEKDKESLEDRLKELLRLSVLPDHVEITIQSNLRGVYLSPDSPNVLSPKEKPPPIVIVGMLIDRRVQPNRSRKRADKLGIASARLPLETCTCVHPNEPLNVDVVLEGMQQWWWNTAAIGNQLDSTETLFTQAATQALQRHYKRHPNRPLHKTERTGKA